MSVWVDGGSGAFQPSNKHFVWSMLNVFSSQMYKNNTSELAFLKEHNDQVIVEPDG